MGILKSESMDHQCERLGGIAHISTEYFYGEGTINSDKLIEILSHLEASSEALDSIKNEMESARPSPPVDEYCQILSALKQVDEAKVKLEGVIRKRKED